LAANNNDVYATWVQHFGSSAYLEFTKSTDDGMTFSTPVVLGAVNSATGAQISADGTDLLIGFTDTNSVPAIVTSADGGVSFSAPLEMSTPAGGTTQEIVVANTGLNDYVSWEAHVNGRIIAEEATSHNGGVTFLPTVDLDPNNPQSREPIITISSSGAVDIVMRTDQNPKQGLIFVQSTDQGNTFSPPEVLADNARHAAVVSDGSNLDIVYLQDSAQGWEAMFIHSADGGTTWSNPLHLSGPLGLTGSLNSSGDRFCPWASAQNGEVTVAWASATDCFAAVSLNGGNTFGAPTDLGAGNSVLPAAQFVMWLNPHGEVEITTLSTLPLADLV
jgi:hypothetical protein